MSTQPSGNNVDAADLLARAARCAAAVYQQVPRQGAGVVEQAGELTHAAELERFAVNLDSGADLNLDNVLTPTDLRMVSQLLLDTRRSPLSVSETERTIVRSHFPEVDMATLDPLERVISYFTNALHDAS